MARKFITHVVMLAALLPLLVSCGKKDTDEKTVWQTFKVTSQTVNTPLYFSGTIKPFKGTSVSSPIDGTISHEFFSYGTAVKKDQKLFTVTSDKLQEDFSDAISGYLKAEADYKTKTKKYKASAELWKLQFISKDSFNDDKTAKDDSFIAFLQATYKVIKIAKQLGVYEELLKIKVVTPDIIKQLLLRSRNYIDITAPKDGIALYPESSTNNNDETKPVSSGSEVKSGQVVLSIGNLCGYKVFVQVDEININQIKVGQLAEVTGPAFPGILLKGQVTRVEAQATASSSGDLPQFPVTVEVSNTNPADQSLIHVGMTAKVAIEIPRTNVLLIPIDAVFQQDGASMVKIKDAQGALHDVPVITGSTSMNTVEIKQGVKAGDTIVYHH
jgi:multidrug efflux pump subunit AcrA (membrane-fusion protein)